VLSFERQTIAILLQWTLLEICIHNSMCVVTMQPLAVRGGILSLSSRCYLQTSIQLSGSVRTICSNDIDTVTCTEYQPVFTATTRTQIMYFLQKHTNK